MKIISIQEGYQRKFARQANAPWLEFHVHGHCVHVGRVSPGCLSCFANTPGFTLRLGQDAGLPDVCNRNCRTCFGPHEVAQDYAPPHDWQLDEHRKQELRHHFQRMAAILPTPVPGAFPVYGITGRCEPLFYLPVIRQYLAFLREEADALLGRRGWAKLYTNGTLVTETIARELRDLGFDEVRVNPSASGFSARVYRAIAMLAKYLPTVSVEVPVWPPMRDGLFAMLPRLADLGVRHLDLCQVEPGGDLSDTLQHVGHDQPP